MMKLYKQDQGSKAPSGHSSFYLCLPFYQIYLSFLSFAPSIFVPSLHIYANIHFTFISILPLYPVYLLNLSFAPSRRNIIMVKIVKMVKNCQNGKKMSIDITSLPIESIIRSIYMIYRNIP